MKLSKNKLIYLILLLAGAAWLRYFLIIFISEENSKWSRMVMSLIILMVGAAFVLRGTAKIIEETTEVLSKRTKIAGGRASSAGNCFPGHGFGNCGGIN